MKKIYYLIVCLSLFVVSGCSLNKEAKPVEHAFKMKETYHLKNGVHLKLRAIEKVSIINPTNMNDEYLYWQSNEQDEIMYDVQFYVENNTKKELDLSSCITAELSHDDLTINTQMIMESQDHKKILDTSTLQPNTKTVFHIVFYVNKAYSEDLEKEETKFKFIFDKKHYTLPFKLYEPENIILEKDKEIKASNLKIKVLSASTSRIIPPLFPTEASSYYQQEDSTKRFTGMYMEVENLNDETIDLNNVIGISIDQNGTSNTAWFSILTPDKTNFIEEDTLEPHERRAVLLFGEVDAIMGESSYTVHLYIDGKPYAYTYQHTNYTL